MDSSKKKRTNDLPKDNSDYVKNMSKNGVWGDSVTLQAAADTVNFYNLFTLTFNSPRSFQLSEQVFAIMQFGVKNSGHYIGKRSIFHGDCS